jgi:hypothetical protein
MYLSLLTGIPQSVWRERHLAHHAGLPPAAFFNPTNRPVHKPVGASIGVMDQRLVESAAILALWLGILSLDPSFFVSVYVPGYLTGLALCYTHGHFEHARGAISHYGLLYNISFFNDGYHVEHHTRPGAHWTRLPALARPGTNTTRWPAVLRWLEAVNLERLERLVLRSALLQWFLLRTHEQALRRLLAKVPEPATVKIVGGGMFPRSALILRRLFPNAQITIVDRSAENLKTAKTFLDDRVNLVHGVYDPADEDESDLIVVPLAFIGDRKAIYRKHRAGFTLVHDWIWSKQGESALVSVFLLKRLNLVQP